MPKKRHRVEERFKERFWLQKQRKGFMAEVLAERGPGGCWNFKRHRCVWVHSRQEEQ